MWLPFGEFNSPDYHNTVLWNWLRLKNTNFAGEGWAGLQFFITARPSLGFCIEHRGPGGDPWFKARLHFPFDATDRKSRRLAFGRALLSLQGEYLLGDYPGKVRLWDRIAMPHIPSWGEIVRMRTHTRESNYTEYRSPTDKVEWERWVRWQREGWQPLPAPPSDG